MGPMRPLNIQAERHFLRLRTRLGHATAIHHLDLLAGRGRHGYLCPCGDTQRAAEQVDAVLKHRMFPSTW